MFFKLLSLASLLLLASNCALYAYKPQASLRGWKEDTYEDKKCTWAKISFDQDVTDDFAHQFFTSFKSINPTLTIPRLRRYVANIFFIDILPFITQEELQDIIDQMNQKFIFKLKEESFSAVSPSSSSSSSHQDCSLTQEEADRARRAKIQSIMMNSAMQSHKASTSHSTQKSMHIPQSVPMELTSREALEKYVQENIPGARFKEIEDSEVEEALANGPEIIQRIIKRINLGYFPKNRKNLVLFGLPGTGKTTLTRAIAKKCDIPCLFFAAGQIATAFQASAEQSIHNMFAAALKYGKPCIIVIDELGILIKQQSNQNSHLKTIIDSLWLEIDHADNSNVIVMFTLNSREDLPAPLEDRVTEISIELPTQEQRERAIAYHLTKIQDQWKLTLEDGITPNKISRMTDEFSHRDIENMIPEAVGHAIECDCKFIEKKHIVDAVHIIESQPNRKKARIKYKKECEANKKLYDAKKKAKKEAECARIWNEDSFIGLVSNMASKCVIQ